MLSSILKLKDIPANSLSIDTIDDQTGKITVNVTLDVPGENKTATFTGCIIVKVKERT